MAVEWNITPSTEYTTYGNGIKLTIPSENPPAKYIITYSDDNGCMGSTTVIVRTDCGGGGGGDCLCDITGEFNREGHPYPATGSTSDVKIGQITYKGDCTSTTFRRIEIRDDGPSSIWSSASDFDIKPNGEVWATVPPNEYNTMLHVRVYFNCKTSDTAPDYDYLNFYQAAGSEPQPADCDEPNPNQDLNTMISVLTNGTPLSGKINPSDTPCTYTHLLHAWGKYGHLTDRGSWFMANIFSELTPVKEDSTKYFKNAANEYGGICKSNEDFFDYEGVYNNRIDGGVDYADYKRTYYDTSQENVRKARTELVSITAHAKQRISGTSIPSAIESPLKCGDLTYFNQGSPDLLAVVPKITSTRYGSTDWNRTQSLIDGCSSPTNACAAQAIADDTYEMSHFCDILGVSEDEYSDYLLFTTDIVDDITNRAKDSVSRYRPYGENCHRSRSSERFKCGDEHWTECTNTFGNCTLYLGTSPNGTNPDDTNSYPSGHSSKGFMAYLVLLEKINVSSKRSRIDEYCHNRAKLRAHWESDVIVGKLAASMVIGYLNGFKSFHLYLSNPKCVKKHSNEACGCDCGFDIPTGC